MHIRTRPPVSGFPICFKDILEERKLVGLLTESQEKPGFLGPLPTFSSSRRGQNDETRPPR